MHLVWIFIHGLSALFAALGVAFLGVGLRDVWRAARTRRWPTAPGAVVSTEVLQHPRPVRGDAQARPQLHYEARVHYEYTVGRVHVGSSVLSFTTVETSSEARAREVLARYPSGKAVQVAYDPADPTESVLEPGAHGADYVRGVVGVVFLLVAGGIQLAAHWLLAGR